MKTLIKNATIVTMNSTRDVIVGDILIENQKIVALGTIADSSVDKTIDAKLNPVIPGFVQTHIHLCQTLMRHMADDLVLIDWLRNRIWPYEAQLTPHAISIAAKIGLAELVLGGTTAIVDMGTVNHTDHVMEAIRESGIFAIAGKCMMDFGDEVPAGLMEKTADSIAESVRLMNAWNGTDDRIFYGFAPRFAVSCTESLLREVGEIARSEGAFIHTHGSETEFENAFTQERHACSNVAFFGEGRHHWSANCHGARCSCQRRGL